MEVAAETDRGTVLQPAARDQLRPIARLLGEVPAQPRLAVGKEGIDVTLRFGPAAAAHGRDGHHHATFRVDHDAQAARPRGAAKGVGERATGQTCDGRGLGRDDGGRRCRPAARAGRPSPGGHDRRSRRPGRSPVSAPSRIAARPLTMTWSMPVG